ncbi:hypothetical protein EPN83_01365 [Patescibacteria group bacterium]|nr:MAG: hypothetical protein EPN83_01365 [Patescibacteria group bacterium]
MRRFPLTLVVALLILMPAAASAATFRYGENYSLLKDEAVEGDFYVASPNATIAGRVSGDLQAIGGNVFLGNGVAQDVFIIGGTVNSIGSVGGDLRIIGGTVVISGRVLEDLVVAGANSKVLSTATIQGNAVLAGGQVALDGTVRGNLKIVGGRVTVNAVIDGSADIAADELIIGPNTRVLGDLSYAASRPALVDPAAKIFGETTYKEISTRSKVQKLIPTFWGTWVFVRFFMLLVGALVLHGVFRRISERFVQFGISHFLKSFLWGFLFLLAVPVASVLVLLTFVGMPFVLLGASIYVLFLTLAFFYSPILLGAIIWKLARREAAVIVSWKSILLGVVVVTLLGYLPYGGIVLKSFLFVIALGAIGTVLFQKFSEVR